MRFTLYTEKSLTDAVKTLSDRIQAKQNSKNGVRGNVAKNGEFSLWVSCKVAYMFKRTTTMNGKIGKEGGNTVIQGFVPDGMSPYWMTISGVVWAVVCLGFLLIGEPTPAILGVGVGLFAGFSLRGDYRNSESLLIDIEKTLKASPKPPKKK